jgi:hypothetical protein
MRNRVVLLDFAALMHVNGSPNSAVNLQAHLYRRNIGSPGERCMICG